MSGRGPRTGQLGLTLAAGEDDRDFGERWARTRGLAVVLGVDEVGRGPLAGPVVAGAAVVPRSLEAALLEAGLTDSKKLTEKRRTMIAERVHAEATVGLGVVDAARIDETNILKATFEAMRLAIEAVVEALEVPPSVILVDGREPIRPSPLPAVRQKTLVKGDSRSVNIAAASVVAKVHRDGLMVAAEEAYPGYGFALHKGYGAPEHLEALRRLGPCPLHRRSFRGVLPEEDGS